MLILQTILAVAAALASVPSADEGAIRAAEELWHGPVTAQSAATLLAEDFARPMPSGELWGKTEQVAWLAGRPAPPGMTGKPEKLQVRIFGDWAVATGVAIIADPAGKVLDRTIFTDVYAKRDGQWLMVSAQRGPAAQAVEK